MSVFLIVGPTAVGKTGLAVELALRYDAVVLSADAMTVYQGLDVGTAKPTMEERRGVTHFGIDVCRIDAEFSVASFLELFDEVCTHYPRVIVVGGTHFYFNSLLNPLAAMPSADMELRKKLEAIEDLHGELQKADPVSAKRIHPNDRIRLVRAMEIFTLTGRPFSEVQKDPPRRVPLRAPLIWIDREDVRDRIQQRLSVMMQNGYLDECRNILHEGWNLNEKPLKSFSYRYMLQAAKGDMATEEALEKTEFGSWRLVRKQRTWARGLGWEPIHTEEALEHACGVIDRQQIF
ncbi:MAG: tRNA (adenosine(37)-N6)-dimethylallyltransferase MiaA [Myxococcota bacterium]|nr:tRNA (adenosine(37)-N6)-dimethylallyltransferase MiaA [Myxococcota bacterium]